MNSKRMYIPILAVLVAIIIYIGNGPCLASSGKSKEKDDAKLTAKELQASLMSYADMVTTVMGQIVYNIKDEDLPLEIRLIVLRDMTYTVSTAVTIAAEPNPLTGLLDATVIITVGRMIYEQYWIPKHGKQLEMVLKGYRKLEENIWKTASEVLNAKQLQELENMIAEHRKTYPNQTDFVQLRFADFSALRAKSPLASQAKSGGLLAPVSDVTRQLEATERLAERAMFLATRLPLMTGAFMDVWLSLWLTNPEVKDVTEDVKTLSVAGHELAALLQKLPPQLQQISSTTVKEAMNHIGEERKNIVKEFSTESRKLVNHIFLLAFLFVIIAIITFFGVKFVYKAALKRAKLAEENHDNR